MSVESYSRQQTQETTPSKQHQFRHKSTHQHTNTLAYYRKDSKKILIPFEQTLQVRDVDQIKAHIKIIVDKSQGGYIKLYLHKWKKLTFDFEHSHKKQKVWKHGPF